MQDSTMATEARGSGVLRAGERGTCLGHPLLRAPLEVFRV